MPHPGQSRHVEGTGPIDLIPEGSVHAGCVGGRLYREGRRLRRRTKALLHAVRSVIEAAMRIGGACGGRWGGSVNGVPSRWSSGSVLGTIKLVTFKSVTDR